MNSRAVNTEQDSAPALSAADVRPLFDLDDPFLARAAWSRVAEPGDEVASALVTHLGPAGALQWLYEAVASGGLPRAGLSNGSVPGGPDQPTLFGDHDVSTAHPLPTTPSRVRLAKSVARWSLRLVKLDPRRELHSLYSDGGQLLTPEGPWPASLDALGSAAPLCLWVRGSVDVTALAPSSVALVGARACTHYGEGVAAELAAGLVDRGFTVVSGGAYGIDAAVHRGALAAGGPTIAFLAGGVDRLYPAGNTDLLRAVIDNGAVVSEVPPGSVPSRVRFLLRNRLIAAFCLATVVVEAAWRSGSLSTAARAGDLLRPVGAVPGPVTSMASAGCHRLLRDSHAVCVTDADEVAELAGGAQHVAPVRPQVTRPQDGLDDVGARVFDALPLREGAPIESLARTSGLASAEVLGAVGHLELLGHAQRHGRGWRRALRGR